MDKELLPSRRAEAKQRENQKATEERIAREEMIKRDFAVTFGSDEGQRVLAYIMERCNFGKVILSADSSKKIDPMATTFAAMELNLYLDLRAKIPADILALVEYGSVKPSGNRHELQKAKQKGQ